MENGHLSLIIRERTKGTSQVQLTGIVPVRRIKPHGVGREFDIALANLAVVQDGVTHAGKQVRLYIRYMVQGCALKNLQKDLMDCILSAASLTCNRHTEEEQRRAMPPIQLFGFDSVRPILHSGPQ
ncbi:hypothetical protein SBA7_710036 [Candidatus Sulfotelmatobacter sp. SbA7]|nr:hypothetical protein SBA7_710036 [Candidatus Sulfotelmatobacter sp. SbA7]